MSIESRLDAVANRAISDNRIVGTVLLVKQHGQTIYEKAHGLADREAGRPMAQDAIFRLSSLTKPIVAATILAMVDRGDIRLDDPITQYLPAFQPRLSDGTTPVITLHHLLTHTSGVNEAGFENSPAENAAGQSRWHHDNDTMLARLAAAPLLFKPGSEWSYGHSIDVLGVLAAKLMGRTLDEAIQKLVAGPLGMADTRFFVTDRSRLAAAYADGAVLMGDYHEVNAPWGGVASYDPGRIFDAAAFQSGGGGMAGSGPDFMRLIEALRTGGSPILSQALAEIGLGLQTPQLVQAQGPGWHFSYFGAFLDDPERGVSPAATGTVRWGGIYGHNWFIDQAIGLSVVSMSNTGLEGCDGPYKDEVRNAVYGVS